MDSVEVPRARARSHAPTRLALLILTAAIVACAALMLCTTAPAAAKPFAPLPGWATLEGGNPLVGATVRVYRGRTTKTRLRGPWSADQTYKTGTFVFDASTLPKTFVVAVSGGTIRGEAFTGTLRATVTRYHSPQTVYLNPVTTLISVYFARHPHVTIATATARVKRFLAIPSWQDIGADLQHSRTYFSGVAFRDEAAQYGGFNRFVSLLAGEVGRRGTKHPFPGKPGLTAGPPSTSAWIVNGLAQGALTFAGGQTLGWVLGQFGLGDGVSGELAQIQAQLAQISMQLTSLQNEVAQAAFGSLVAGAADYTSEIANALKQLSTIANLDPNDPNFQSTKTMLTNSLLAYIGGATSDKPCSTGPAGVGLLEKQDILNGRLVQSGVGTDGILVAGSRVMTRATRFWTSGTTQQVQTLFDYYAAREAELLMMRVEFWHACGLSGSYIQQQIADEQAQVAAQQGLQKPSPSDSSNGFSFLLADTTTNLMWFNYVPGGTYGEGDGVGSLFSQMNQEGHPYGYSDWRLPRDNELVNLFAPAARLVDTTGFQIPGGLRYLWTDQGYDGRCGPPGYFYDLIQGEIHEDLSDDCDSAFNVLPVRALTASESYWYPVNP
jgi:hypothetical protein